MEVGNLTHSHSQPGEIDRTPPGTPKKGGKMLAVRVQMLDDTVTMFQIQAKALGRVLFDQVCNQLNLLESDYFGLEYQEAGGTKYWLDLEKPVCRQIGLSLVDMLVRFCVKFYTPDPSQLEEEFTRYLFCLQIKRDLSQGLLQCNSNTAALMASYIVQAECGDYVVEDYPDHRYLSSYKFVPNQDQELERRIMENHKKHAKLRNVPSKSTPSCTPCGIMLQPPNKPKFQKPLPLASGQSPAEADLNLLETARRCELYGIKMHPAKDHEGCPLNLAVAHMGIVVFQNFSKINTFSWAKIRKISFKRKRFLVKLHPEGYGYYKDTVEFFFEGRNECKNFWKKCVENHGFFRCTMVKKVPRQKTRVLSRGSSFRYSGRTQKQIVDFVRENYVKRQTFQRSQSFRHSSSAHSSVANVGTSISAHPLLPLGDNAVAGTPASLSCGSMTLTSSPVHTADIHVGGSPSPPLTTSVSPGTSVTSSPQHIYPQETPYRRTGHRPTKVKHSPVRSHHAISPLSPTHAATTAANRSANRSNNVTPDVSDIVTSPNSFKRPDFIRFNHGYSNCYTSFRSLANDPQNDVSVMDGTKIDIFRLPSHLFNGTPNTNESIASPEKRSKTLLPANKHDFDRYTWHRSASCKDLCRDADAINQKTKIPTSKASDETGAASPVTLRDKCRRKCYSALVSKNPSIDRTGDGSSDMRVYSSSYPGTTSSLSTESAEGELEEHIAEVLDIRYDSQEDIGLSHDDVSHDSYELLERELEERHEDSLKSRRDMILVGENERARSCSWGSDRGVNLLDFHSTGSGIGSGLDVSREQNFWSLERERSSKHKSESDFRSLGSKCSRDCRSGAERSEGTWRYYDGTEGMGITGEFLDYDSRLGKSKEIKEEIQKTMTWKKQLENRTVSGKESCRSIGEEIDLRKSPREWEESYKGLERQKYEKRRKSIEESGMAGDFYVNPVELSREVPVRLEEVRRMEKRREKKEREERFHEGLKEKEEKEWEMRQGSRRKSVEEELRGEEVPRKMMPKSSGYGNFQEIQFKKFDRVVSNQFGRYSEFLTQENSFFAQEKVMENYDKVCQMNRVVKELKNSPSGNVLAEKCVESIEREKAKGISRFGGSMEFVEWKNGVSDSGRLPDNSGGGSRAGRALIERTKSDPYNSVKSQKRNILSHQKSVDLTPQQSEETISDYDNEDGFKKGSRSEHDIPYVLHKRHCMNGTARNADLKMSMGYRSSNPSEGRLKISKIGIEAKKFNLDVVPSLKQRPSSAKVAEAKKAGVQIINLDAKNGKAIVNIPESKRGSSKSLKAPSSKKITAEDSKPIASKVAARKELRKPELLPNVKKDMLNTEKTARIPEETFAKHTQNEEPIYAEVCKEKPVPDDESLPPQMVPPQPPKRSSSCSQKPESEDQRTPLASERGEPPQRRTGTCEQESAWEPLEEEGERRNEWKVVERKGRSELIWGWGRGRGKGAEVHGRREESQTLFARTRLGVSEGSAFAAILREGVKGSPGYQRRAKSLDAPYVSVHSLPPADAFSSKDDTVEGSEEDIVNSAVSRFRDFRRGEGKGNGNGKTGEIGVGLEVSGNTESEVDSVFTDDLEMDSAFKKSVENQSKVEISFGDEKVLDAVRGKRLLSKIESVDFIDSEGDMDSSRLAEPQSIPSDRLVNLPECIRFPSVRQISGQTSEESADGWDQEKVKVKRRTPRRSVGREEQDVCRESVVWDSKDEEPPDEVWDEKLGAGGKYEGLVVNVGLGGEYLKRGSCGQSIDDDNLSTPMKESSPEHWVSVDDLPEALEREEKLLKQQEKILREKILNEKLKRELNLDTIDIDERFCDFKDNVKQSKYEEETVSLKESLKGHSLDTYELIEKKGRERRPNKMCTSLDEDLLSNKLFHAPVTLNVEERPSADEPAYAEGLDYMQCKVVKDMAEIEQFGDNDEELEEFFVVLDEGLGRENRNMVWEDEDSLRRTLSNDESLISVPEEFKDVEKDAEESPFKGKVEILLSEVGGQGEQTGGDLTYFASHEELGYEVALMGEEKKLRLEEGGGSRECAGDVGGLSPLSGSRRGSEEKRKPSLSEETGRLSPYDSCSRRGSDEPRRPSTSEDSRKCSVSESVSEETRRRLSSTEETRRKRASLTKQCSVGADSLSDEVISGIQECSSSFEHDEKDVFEAEPVNPMLDSEEVDTTACVMNFVAEKSKELLSERLETLQAKHLEGNKAPGVSADPRDGVPETNSGIHLAPPSSERELSRETEDSMDYGEGDLKDITDTVKEKDMSDEAVPDSRSLQQHPHRSQSSVEKSEFSENDDFRYIDEKRGGTPEIIVGKSKEDVAMSIVVVNEGISVLKKINEKDRGSENDVEAQPLPMVPVFGAAHHQQRHTLPKTISKPKSLTPKSFDYAHRKLIKNYVAEIKVKTPSPVGKESTELAKTSLDSSQESDLDKLSDISLVSHVQREISKRNLSDAGKCLRRDDIGMVTSGDSGSWKTSSEEKEKTDQSSGDDIAIGEERRRKEEKLEKAGGLQLGFEGSKGKREGGSMMGREKKSPDQEKRDSGEDGSSSSSAPLCPKRELSSTWKPFLLESSGSSSLEEGWLPPDESAHLADEEETSSTSNNQQDDSYHDDIDYPTGIGYPVLNVSNAEMMIGTYGNVYTLSRTLSRISERSMSEQERSDLEDDITKPTSHSISIEEESILSSDHQPSLSSDPPSPKEIASTIPDLPVDRPISHSVPLSESSPPLCEPFDDVIPPPVPEEDWPSPPSSPSIMDTPVVSHIETFYMEIHPEEACKVVVAESREGENSSSDDNQTLHEESEFLVLSSDNMSASTTTTTTTTTQDGTVVIPMRPKSGKRGSVSEEASVISNSERSGITCMSEEASERGKGTLSRNAEEEQGEISRWSTSPAKYCPEQDSQKSKISARIKPLKLSSPTGKTFGFFETPVSKVRSPTSQIRFFETADRGASGCSTLRSPTSFSETTSPKNYGRFFDSSATQTLMRSEVSERCSQKSPNGAKGYAQRSSCTPYYSNVADSAEKSYFGRYDTGSLERTKIQSSRKCSSYYSVSRTAPTDGDGSNSDGPPAPSPNTIPRASKRTKKRHRVAMDLIVRDGRIVAPPKTNTIVLENSDSDRSLSH